MLTRNKHFYCIVFLLFFGSESRGQDVLSLKQYVSNIKEHHPYVKIANNKLLYYAQKLKIAKGAFDPKFKGSFGIKNFEQKEYFDLREAKIIVPTRLGISPIVKYSRNEGFYLNPENNVPENGLLGIGIDIPLLRGLLIDNERKVFKQSDFEFKRQTFVNDSVLNSILYIAIIDYINWAINYSKLKVLDDLVLVRQDRYINVYNGYLGGANSPMDTLEAHTQYQKAIRDQLSLTSIYIKSTYKIRNHIWDTVLFNRVKELKPEPSENVLKALLWQREKLNINQHNYIQSLLMQKKQREVQLKYEKEMFKPKVDLAVVPLTRFSNEIETISAFRIDNFSLNLNIEIPLNYRKQMGYYHVAKMELENINFKLEMKKREINNKQLALNDILDVQKKQYSVSFKNTQQLGVLREMEEYKFMMGESFLLKLNIRENKLLDEQIKTLDVLQKYNLSLLDQNLLFQSIY